MKIIGTIVEYNPIHNGHIYAIEEIKKQSQADFVIAVMSGNFTMRGELSIFDKFTKTNYALQAGLDLIIELPTILAVQNSDLFAKHAVQFLNLAGVSEIWIGSESNDPTIYEKAYQLWNQENTQKIIKEKLNEGMSYKMATAEVINLPSNDLLGYSYYKAIKDLSLNIALKTIKRQGSGYTDLKPHLYASSMAIRSDLSLMDEYCPSFLDKSLIRAENQLFDYLKYNILTKSSNELKNIFLVEEGVENSLLKIQSTSSLNEFKNLLTSKRYTKSRISRMLVYVLLNITKDEVSDVLNSPLNYIRVLGYNDKGLNYLKQIKKNIQIYTNLKEGLYPILDLEMKTSKLLDAIYKSNLLSLEQSKPTKR